MSHSQIHFLDLNIIVKDGHLSTTTYFKETDRNAYIPLYSCYHASWLNAVPKGQFQWIRLNCTYISDFYQQAYVLRSRFLEKGYSENDTDDTIKVVGNMNRDDMLHRVRGTTQGSDNSRSGWSMTAVYSNQYFSVRKILSKYWGSLKNDKVLGPIQSCSGI